MHTFQEAGEGRSRYFRRRRVRLSTRFRLRPEPGLPSRFAFAATCRRYRCTMSSPEAPAIRLAVASNAARIFSLTMSSASRRALLPPRISFIIRSAMTVFASAANNIKGLTIRRPCIAAYQAQGAEMVPNSCLSSAGSLAMRARAQWSTICVRWIDTASTEQCRVEGKASFDSLRGQRVARMSEARCGVKADKGPGCRFAHPGYACFVHFVSGGWSIELAMLPAIISSTLDLIEAAMQQQQVAIHLKEVMQRRLHHNLAVARAALAVQ